MQHRLIDLHGFLRRIGLIKSSMSSRLAPENDLTVTRWVGFDNSQPFTYLMMESPTITEFVLMLLFL
jgi:hypothetical protein